MHEDLQKKYLPSIGVASRPVDHKYHESLDKLNNIDQLMDKAIDFQANTAGSLGTWTPENRAKADVLTNSIKTQMNDITQLNRVNGFEGDAYTKEVGKIGSMNAGGELARLREVKAQIQDHKANMMRSLGVKPFTQAGQGGAGSVRVQSPSGQVGMIPAGNLQTALAKGYKQVQ